MNEIPAVTPAHPAGVPSDIIVEVVNTGTELLLGRTLNSHQPWIADQLARKGYFVSRQVTVADSAASIEQAVAEALARADLVITTGGLGPTSDDLTREAIARMLGKELRENPDLRNSIAAFFAKRNRPVPESTRREAMAPDGAIVLPNNYGTAPGLAIEVNPNRFRHPTRPSWLIMLPGPPRELQPMFLEFVLPLINQRIPSTIPFASRTLKTVGIGESVAQEKIEGALAELVHAGLEVGYCARPGRVDVRVSARHPDANALVVAAEKIVRAQLSDAVFGEDGDELENRVVQLLTERRETLALAESCTGGFIADRLTNVPGASAVLRAGLVTYSNSAKENFLGVRRETLEKHGAVSEQVAREMAEGARHRAAADYAIAVTGIAGPTGGAPEKPIGTVFIGLASPTPTLVWRMFNPWDRLTFKAVTAQQALNQLRIRLEAHRSAT